MNEFFTADLHLGGVGIIDYAGRPYRDVEHMNKGLLGNINSRCKPGDVLYHLGDEVNYGRAKGLEGSRVRPEVYEDLMIPKFINVMGNHDKQNGVKGSIHGMYMVLGKFSVWVQHIPPWYDSDFAVPDVQVYLCGHVHEKWKVREFNGKPVINVGVDVWRYMPVKKSELLDEIRKHI